MKLLILRPPPGAGETAGRAASMGLDTVVAPLFEIRPLDWDAPDPSAFEAVLLTSANTARHGGAQLAAFAGLPCYAVGEATAAAAQEAGFSDIRTGARGAVAVADMLAADGISRALHLCGRDHIAIEHPRVALTRRCVYASEAADALPAEAVRALAGEAVVLLHSARAASRFGALVDKAGLARGRTSLAAISDAAAAAAGGSWKSVRVAAGPRDDALLELAATMCQTEP